ncbi:hypothetical protein KC19_8G132100 [Ceratodon purpureus]|uniref:lipoyl(octanoyl) transferase n=1 Tax=Ceratodon purpureus TaxID=3225 RepID=A0A8T0H061_CERPU|nr:hypothetical protein KC19_8G132100 [Ceratodon purpureus]KAG0564699.1 hypothetical protein KC19_8G132100 [Ceratodon purpureus]KAG0564700.1 hypothetical protein KC19_8G132100 [Ceratodon purpureus]
MASLLWNTFHLGVSSREFEAQSRVDLLERNTRVGIRVWNWQGLGEIRLRGGVQGCGGQRASVVWQRRAVGEVESSGGKRNCECYDQYDVRVPYVDAWQWQKLRVGEKVAMLGREEDFDDTLIILQHPPVYTLGTRSTEANLKFDVNDPSFELHRTERGGEVTYHGPGQLVMYPILNLRHHKMDLHWYLRTLEEVVIGALDKACGIQAHRIDGLTGVWVDNQKVAAVGVRVTRWITYHGVALNVTTDLTPFSNIIPCGISDYSVTSVAKILENSCESRLEMNPEGLLKLLHDCLLAEFEEKFNVHLVPPSQPGPEPVSKASVLELV